jgi:hypothetical protein
MLRFPVHRWLSSTRDDKQLFVELTPRSSSSTRNERKREAELIELVFYLVETYLIATKTVDIHRTNAIDNMQMSIVGSNGRIDRILLKDLIQSNEELFQKGSLNQFEIKEKDIGDEIECITIGFDDQEQQAALLFESIQIKYKSTIYQ